MDKDLELKLFREGMKAGVWLFAHWKDGRQLVGTGGTTLKEAWTKVDNGEYDHIIEAQKKVKEMLGKA